MDPKISHTKGKRGRFRWVAHDLDEVRQSGRKRHRGKEVPQHPAVAMSPRDWDTAEAAEESGNAVLNARGGALQKKIDLLTETVEGQADTIRGWEKHCKELRGKTDAWRNENHRLHDQLDSARQRELEFIRAKKRDKRAVIIAYTVVFGAILVGVSCIALNGIFCS